MDKQNNLIVEFQEESLKSMLSEMSGLYFDHNNNHRFGFDNMDDLDDEQKMNLIEMVDRIEDNFRYLATKVFRTIKAYIESKSLVGYLKECQETLAPYFETKVKLLVSRYHADSGEDYSTFIVDCWNLLSPFPAFSQHGREEWLKRQGVIYLENILESTAVIINKTEKPVTTETEVYKRVKIVTEATFPNANFPSESFVSTAKCYKPDILIPSLNCAIEYKYAETEQILIKTIDEILIDVKGYQQNSIYKIFYAVFYVKSGIWSPSRFNTVWEEKEFPKNWKGIFVQAI